MQRDTHQKIAESYVYAQLPRAGLANMLFIWARARVFADINRLPLLVSSWTKPKIGWLLRREKHPRLYMGYFQKTSSVSIARKAWVLLSYRRIREPELAHLPDMCDRTCYVFHQQPHWSDFFSGIKDYRDQLRAHLYRMLANKQRQQLSHCPQPIIGIHIRRGDFRELRPDEDFARVGLVRTPLNYFQELIGQIRDLHGSCLPVTVFSDGYDHELADILHMPRVSRASANSDIVDLLLLSRSKIIITSAGSTFSSWAVFLSDAPALLHPEHVHTPLRPAHVNTHFFEGGVRGEHCHWSDLLKQNIRNL